MIGHTDRSTINQRRALTPGMRTLLELLAAQPRVRRNGMTGAEENQLRALHARGYAEWHVEFGGYTITDAGREALKVRKP